MSIDELRKRNVEAWDRYREIIDRTPMSYDRTPTQQREYDAARAEANQCKWDLESAEFWSEFDQRERANASRMERA